jgi:hypothetical protein
MIRARRRSKSVSQLGSSFHLSIRTLEFTLRRGKCVPYSHAKSENGWKSGRGFAISRGASMTESIARRLSRSISSKPKSRGRKRFPVAGFHCYRSTGNYAAGKSSPRFLFRLIAAPSLPPLPTPSTLHPPSHPHHLAKCDRR